MIRVLIVDDHVALRAGLTAVLAVEPGIVPLATVATEEELRPMLQRTRPDLVVLDYHLPGQDGLAICRRIKRMMPPPKVLLYSAYADAALAIPAALAGADGVVDKGAPARELYEAIRLVVRGERVRPPLSRELLDDAAAQVHPDDLPVLGMALDDTPGTEIAVALRLAADELDARIDRMLAALRVEVPASAS